MKNGQKKKKKVCNCWRIRFVFGAMAKTVCKNDCKIGNCAERAEKKTSKRGPEVRVK